MTTIKDLMKECYTTSEAHGWWEDAKTVDISYLKAAKIALMHSELSECLEAVRKGDTDNEAEELADVIIRILDYCYKFGISIDSNIIEKMEINKSRTYRHGGKAL